MNRDLLNKDKIYENIFPKDLEVLVYESCDSTNSLCRKLIDEKSACLPFLVVSDFQTQGRGRCGKSFYSPKSSGIYMSIATRYDNNTDNYTICAANAVCKAINVVCDIKAQIKWVNDIFVDGKKVCGILCETVLSNEHEKYVICGIGINYYTDYFPEEIKIIAGSLYKSQPEISRAALISEIVNGYFNNLCKPNDEIIEYYKNNSMVIGKQIEFNKNGVAYRGKATDIMTNGNLVVRTKQGDVVLSSGEISLGSRNFVKKLPHSFK